MKILLIEDHGDSRRNLKRLIEKRGHEVTACASAEEAEEALAREWYPFLISDWMLPGKSGIDLCHEIRKGPSGDEMFILLVTARTEPEDLEMALEAGANDYLTKPLDPRRLNVRLCVAERQIRELHERNANRAALQESARKMSDILENTSDGFFALNSQLNFIYLNAEAESMLGRPRGSLLGKSLLEEFPDVVGSSFEKNYRTVLTDKVSLKFEASDPAGKVWFDLQAYPSGDGLSVFFRNVTERKRFDEERLTTGKLESLGTLAGGIAHDLNNILTVISGNIGLAQLEAPANSGKLLSFLAKAGQAAQHAAHLSNQLLTFSKGGAPLKKVAALGELLEHAADFSLHGSNLRAEIEIEDHLWNAEVDVGQIEQVINALMINAREASANGGSVNVSAANVELPERNSFLLPPGRYVKVSVADQGEGVPEDLTFKIFDPYFTTKSAGSGLGLAISYSIIKKHGGMLHLESTSAEGSTFSFYLPSAPGQVITVPAPSLDRAYRINHQRILVMDDEAAIRELTSQLLTTLGYEVTAVPDGTEAVQHYERALRRGENFQAVILDATVRGGMGGLATIEKLRGLDPQVTAIICSGYSDEAAVSEFLSYGFRGALPKPFTRRELADALQKAFETGKVN
jgi:DNA-binding response OmpR family regulator/nitrogen-specific signal transduction histidine kinase